jgi:radical SAM enzyme (TIGR01210 family)
MNELPGSGIADEWIISKRGKKNSVDPQRPYAWMIEKERTASGRTEDTATIFLTNRECPFHCLMCDLWKNTTDVQVPLHSIPEQIEFALNKMPATRHLKLYNSGSFFDGRAIPEEDYERIAILVNHFETVIIESHPAFIGQKSLLFRDMLKPALQIAMGLETVHQEVLRKLNKRMTIKDFEQAVRFLSTHDIPTRAFVLLRPPYLNEEEGIRWSERSIDFAFDTGVECCVIIPVRAGNGIMEILHEKGDFNPPALRSLETVLEYGISLNKGRVFADTWDLGLFSECNQCLLDRTNRLVSMNLNQQIAARISCDCEKQHEIG